MAALAAEPWETVDDFQLVPGLPATGATLAALQPHEATPDARDPMLRQNSAVQAAGGSAESVVKPGGGHPWLTIPQEVKLMAEWFDCQLVPTEEK